MKQLTEEIKSEIKELVYEFLSDECEVDDLNNDMKITEDLDGDSLLLVEFIEILKKKYDLNIQLQAVGKYLLKNPAETVGQIIEIAYLIYERENDII